MSGSTVVVGIDIAKSYVDVACTSLLAPLGRFDNDPEGHSTLIERLGAFKPGLIIMEASGGYEHALACALQAAGFMVVVINPRRACSDSRGLRYLARSARLSSTAPRSANTRASTRSVLAKRPIALAKSELSQWVVETLEPNIYAGVFQCRVSLGRVFNFLATVSSWAWLTSERFAPLG